MTDKAPSITEEWAASIFTTAVSEGRAAEVLECLFDGGSVTIDAVTGRVALATTAQLSALCEAGNDHDSNAQRSR